MSVTVSFLPFALLYLGAHAATMTTKVISAEIQHQNEKKKLQLDLQQNQEISEQLNRILYPNLYAVRNQNQKTTTKLPVVNEIPNPQAFVRNTFVQDLDITRKTAESLGGKLLSISEGTAFLYKDCGFVLFRSDATVPFDLWILGASDTEAATKLAEEIETEYKRQVQDHVHTALLQRSSEYGLQLESEETQADKSVVLTFTLR